MRLKPKTFRFHGMTIKTCELQNKSIAHNGINLYFYEELPVNAYISQSEYIYAEMLKDNFPKFNYCIDSGNIWNWPCGGTTYEIIIIGNKAKNKALKFLSFLIKDENIKKENIVLYFEDKDFIRKLIKEVL